MLGFGRIRLSQEEKIGLIANMTTMLSAGIPISETVDSLLSEAKGNQKKILLSLREDVTAGKQISDSFSRYPYTFDKVTVSLIKAAEEAGTLEETLRDLQGNIKKEMEFIDGVKSAMFYPIVVMIVFISVLLGMLLFVIPRISTVFSRLNVKLPMATKALIYTSNLLINNWLIVLGILFLLIALLFVLYQTKRELMLQIVLSFPGVSKLIREIDLTRFSRSLHLLLSSGIPITTSLELAQEVILKKEVRDLVDKAREQALAGHPFSHGLQSKRNIIPGIIIKLMEVGEKSGTLEEAMQNVSDNMDYKVSKSVKKMTALLEPLLLVFVGLAVGGMMMAIIAPIYGLIGSVGGR